LATKYIIDELREMALTHLSTAWPSTLKAWDLREDLARSYEIEFLVPAARRYPHPFVSPLHTHLSLIADTQPLRL
jgi:hypothetical protein